MWRRRLEASRHLERVHFIGGNPSAPVAHHPNPIASENALPGTPDWALRNRSTHHEIEGYALRESAVPGDAVAIAVSVNSAAMQLDWTLYRVGYYGGAGAREITRGGPVAVAKQQPCAADTTVWCAVSIRPERCRRCPRHP